jgi:hypothetical protein
VSVVTARVLLVIALIVAIVCATTAVTELASERPPALTGLWLGLGVVAVTFLIAGLLLFPRFVEARVRGDSVVVRRVFGARVIPVADIREIVVLHGLVLPSRVAGPLARRILLRGASTVIEAFSTPTASVADALRRRGVPAIEVHDLLSPSEARRRFPGSVSLAETLLGPVLVAVLLAALAAAAVVVLV